MVAKGNGKEEADGFELSIFGTNPPLPPPALEADGVEAAKVNEPEPGGLGIDGGAATGAGRVFSSNSFCMPVRKVL